MTRRLIDSFDDDQKVAALERAVEALRAEILAELGQLRAGIAACRQEAGRRLVPADESEDHW